MGDDLALSATMRQNVGKGAAREARRHNLVPGVIYVDPEIANVGLSEKQAQEQGIEVPTGTFPMAANGRALATGATDGMVKVVADAKSDKLLGMQIVARGASELIASAAIFLANSRLPL